MRVIDRLNRGKPDLCMGVSTQLNGGKSDLCMYAIEWR